MREYLRSLSVDDGLSVVAVTVLGGIAAGYATVSGAVTVAGRKVMEDAAQQNIAEIAEGHLALTHSKSPNVQALANRVVQDHSNAQGTLEPLAGAMNFQTDAIAR